MKKNLFARIACALMASLMLVTTAVACGKTEDPTATTTAATDNGGAQSGDAAATEQTEAPTVDANGFWLDDIDPTLNYGGETFTFLTWSDVEHPEFFTESQTGDVVNDAMYTRNQIVEERLNITFNEVSTKGNSDNNANFNNYIQTDNLSGAHEFQLICGYSLSVTSAAVNGYLFDLLDESCEHLNFDQPWWPSTLLDQATINNKLRFASGDISMNMLYMMYVCYVNTDILEAHKLEDPAKLVLENKWTYDKFIEMCQGTYEDLNGNGLKDVGDKYGYMSSGIHVDPWFYGTGAVMALQDENGDLKVADSFQSEKVINGIDKINSLLWDSSDGIYTSSVKHQTEFRDEHLLFMTDRARVSFKVLAANENCHYTIVPCPKYDEQQETYSTVMGNPFTLYAIPVDSVNPTMASAVMECFASESYRNTTPAVFEISLKTRYVADSLSGMMYDIIRANITYDVGRIFSSDLIGQSTFRNAVAGQQTWGSVAKQAAKSLARQLTKLNNALNK